MQSFFHLTRIFICAFLLSFLYAPAASFADEALPDMVQTLTHAPLQKVGSGPYRKWGFTIYRATLWAPNGKWDAEKLYALELHYARSLSQETLADSIIDNIRDENVADEATLASWSTILKKTMPAVEDGDVMIGTFNPGVEAVLYFNGNQIAKIKDQALIHAFFNIWLGESADERLKKELLGSSLNSPND